VVKFETRSGRWLAAALTASLAVNVFLGGLFVGRWMGPSPVMAERGPPRGERPMQAMLDRISGALDAEDRAIFETVMDKHRPRLAATGTEFRNARRRTVDLMSAEPFDAAKLEAAMATLRERNLEFQQTLHGALIDAAAALPPGGRQKMATFGRPRSERERPSGG
jgi:uncharacterized membrane protein